MIEWPRVTSSIALACFSMSGWLAAAPVAGAGPSVALVADGGSAALALEVDVLPRDPHLGAPRIAWRAEGAALVGVAHEPRYRATLRLTPAEGRVSLEVDITYLAAMTVDREAIRLHLPGPALALGRDLAFRDLRSALRVDRGTPVLVATSAAALVGGPGIEAARYDPVASGGVDVDLILDDADGHPFQVYEKCYAHLPHAEDLATPVRYAELEKKRSMARLDRRPGESVSGRASLYLLLSGEFRPLVAERWPRGARAALVFTDHADRTDPLALRALLHGTSDPTSPAYGRGGLLGHGVRITRSFFVHAPRGGLDDPEIRPLARELLAAGSEVAVHSISGDPDDRTAVKRALEELSPYRVVTWIDHQPYTNCEAISNQGWRVDGRYGIRDLLAEAGFRWIWEAGDLGGFGAPALVNLFGARSNGQASPILFPLPADPRLWVFQSAMFYGTAEQLAAALQDEPLDRLERERGLFVGHTYFGGSARTTRRPENLKRIVVRSGPLDTLVLDPRLDAALARIEAHVKRGTLASMTWSETGDRLRDLGEVEVTYLEDGTSRVENHGLRAIAGLTLYTLGERAGLAVEGQAEIGRQTEENGARIWFDLPAGGFALIRAGRPFSAARRVRVVLR